MQMCRHGNELFMFTGRMDTRTTNSGISSFSSVYTLVSTVCVGRHINADSLLVAI